MPAHEAMDAANGRFVLLRKAGRASLAAQVGALLAQRRAQTADEHACRGIEHGGGEGDEQRGARGQEDGDVGERTGDKQPGVAQRGKLLDLLAQQDEGQRKEQE